MNQQSDAYIVGKMGSLPEDHCNSGICLCKDEKLKAIQFQ